MKKRVMRNLVMVVMLGCFALTMACAKKNVVGETAVPVSQQSTIDQAAEEAARIAAQEKAKAMEEQRLHEQALRESAARAKQMEAREQFENQNVLFDYDSAVLSFEARQILKEKAQWLEENPASTVVVQGHCDERGTTEYNLALGEQRGGCCKEFSHGSWNIRFQNDHHKLWGRAAP